MEVVKHHGGKISKTDNGKLADEHWTVEQLIITHSFKVEVQKYATICIELGLELTFLKPGFSGKYIYIDIWLLL